MELTAHTATAEATRSLGRSFAPLLRIGDTVVLTGDLGAGKTTLVQGVARGLGIDVPVTSPTFTLVKEYPGSLPITHADVFRLDRVQDVVDLALEESTGVIFVEWGDVVEDLFGDDTLRVELTNSGGDADVDGRRIVFSAAGPTWGARWERLEQAIEPWEVRS